MANVIVDLVRKLIIGSTTIESGTDGRVLFEDSGVVQQDGALHWDNTNKRLGVGTTSPSQKLDVNGGIRVNGGNIEDNSSTVTTLTVKSSSSGSSRTLIQQSGSRFSFSPDVNVDQFVINENGRNVDFRVEGDNDANLIFTDAENDRVGIGTTSPSGKLDVAGEISVSSGYNNTQSPSVNPIIYRALGTSGDFDRAGDLILEPRAASNFIVANNGNRQFVINPSGNVGIGANTPSEKLEVNGNVKISGDMLKMTGITTTERNALTSQAGDIIYNTTDNKHQGYDGTAWNNLY